MEAEIIREKTAELPVIPLGVIPEDHEIWEGDDGGAHFKITRQPVPILKDVEFYALSLSGSRADVNRLISEFIEVLGEPDNIDAGSYPIEHVAMVSWLIKDEK